MKTTNPLRTLHLLALASLCGAATALAQTSTPAATPGPLQQKLEGMTPEQREAFLESHPGIRNAVGQRRQELLGQYSQLPAGEQAQFLQNHPQLQKFIQNHPGAVTRAQANAAEAKPGVVDPGHPRVNEVNQREENQQQRISQGDAAGTLNAGETSRLENQENKIQSQETKDMDEHNGHLTLGEQHQLNHEENRVSNHIYDDKHDITPPAQDPGHPRVNEVNDRENNQQNRISQGMANGSLTGGQAANLEKKEGQIKSQEANDMAKDNGHLTRHQQRQLNQEENRASRKIHKEKE